MRAVFYIQLVPEWCEGVNADGSLNLYGVTVERMTQREPLKPLPGAVVVPVVLEVSPGLFGALAPVQALVEGTPGEVRLA